MNETNTDTPIYDQTYSASIDHAIETGQDDILDFLEEMDKNTNPKKVAERTQARKNIGQYGNPTIVTSKKVK